MAMMESRLNRRQWIARAGAFGAAALMAPKYLRAADAADPRVTKLVRSTIGIDTHNHIDVALFPDILPQPDIDLAGAIRESGLSAVVMAFALDYQRLVDPGDGYKRFLNGLNSLTQQLERNHMTRALTAADVRAAHRAGRPTLVQSVEGAHWLQGKLERIAEAYGRGLRHFCLLHDSDANPPLGATNTRREGMVDGGLTPLGGDVIRECNRTGIIVDLAHSNFQTTMDAIKVSKTPVLFSHTGLNTRLDYDPEVAQALLGKLVSPEQAKAIAQSGGVVGVWTHVALTPEQYGANIRAMVDVCGIDHVCIGTDSKITPALGVGGGPGALPNRRSIGGLTSKNFGDQQHGFYYLTVDGLLKAGFKDADIAKIGGENYLRLMDAAAAAKS